MAVTFVDQVCDPTGLALTLKVYVYASAKVLDWANDLKFETVVLKLIRFGVIEVVA